MCQDAHSRPQVIKGGEKTKKSLGWSLFVIIIRWWGTLKVKLTFSLESLSNLVIMVGCWDKSYIFLFILFSWDIRKRHQMFQMLILKHWCESPSFSFLHVTYVVYSDNRDRFTNFKSFLKQWVFFSSMCRLKTLSPADFNVSSLKMRIL